MVSDTLASCKACNTAVQATAKKEEPADGVDHIQSDEGEQVWYWVAVAAWFRVVWVITHFITPPGDIVLEDPYTTHQDPAQEESVNKSIKDTTD